MRLQLAAIAAAFAVLIVPAAAEASSGTITRAYANANWMRGDLAGQVDWTDCSPGAFCSWIAVATVQPSLPEYRCLGDEALDSDPNTATVWGGAARSANGSAAFALPDALILNGVFGQRLCVSVIETKEFRDPICVAQAPILGMDPNSCPFIKRITGRVMATAMLTVPPPSPPPSPPPPTPAPPSSTPPPSTTPSIPTAKPLTRAQATVAARTAVAGRFGKRWRKGSAKTLSCRRESSKKQTCAVSWRYAKKRFKGTVTITQDGANRTTAKVRVDSVRLR